jgi:SAM-dependent methyltransferase
LSALVVATKLIESEGLSNVTLVRGSALSLPFPDGVFDYAMAINVLEHVFKPAQMLQEVHRVLATGGVFGGDSRNRFDLFFREPHVGLRWVGFLPRRWMLPYVRWRKGISYHQTHLLSFNDLRRALQTAFGSEWRITLPEVSAYGAPARAEQLIEQASRFGPLRALLTRLSPTHLALARRAG